MVELRSQCTLEIFTFSIAMLDSLVDFPVIACLNRMIPIRSVSGIGLLIFLLETLEMLMKPKSTIVESKIMKEGEVELGEETFLIVMLLFEEIDPVILISSTTERSWM